MCHYTKVTQIFLIHFFSCIEQLLKLQHLVTLSVSQSVCPTLGITHFMST